MLLDCIVARRLFSIKFNLGGRFVDDMVYGVKYDGGRIRWIHAVDPTTFTLPQLFELVMGRLRQGQRLPLRAYYQRVEDAWPGCIRLLITPGDLASMFADMQQHQVTEVEVYFVSYAIGKPLVPGPLLVLEQDITFVAMGAGLRQLYVEARNIQRAKIDLGFRRVRDKQMAGKMPYVSLMAIPIHTLID